MKYIKRVAWIPTLFFAMVSYSAFAAGDPVTITVTGNIVASPCGVDPESVAKNVDLGDIQAADMAAAGSASPWASFTISLINCPAGTTSVVATFNGTSDPDDMDEGYLNTGTATNVDVQLEGSGGDHFGNGKTFYSTIGADRAITYNLRARAHSAKGGVMPGTVSSVITMSFTYN